MNAIKGLTISETDVPAATNPKVTALIEMTEPASPSIPSIKFTAFETPTIHAVVTNQDKNPKWNEIPNGR